MQITNGDRWRKSVPVTEKVHVKSRIESTWRSRRNDSLRAIHVHTVLCILRTGEAFFNGASYFTPYTPYCPVLLD